MRAQKLQNTNTEITNYTHLQMQIQQNTENSEIPKCLRKIRFFFKVQNI